MYISLLLLSLLATGGRSNTEPPAAGSDDLFCLSPHAEIEPTGSTQTKESAEAKERVETKVSVRAVFDRRDSMEVEKLLADRSLNTSLDFARKLKGRPYVAHTLEAADPERVVVNLRGLDCATLVETASALALTRREGGRSFSDYCRRLERIRYRNGKCAGYVSRLHYLTFWIDDHLKRGTIEEVRLPQKLTRPLHVKLHYMSRHAEAYKMLKNRPERVAEIAAWERKHSGAAGRFLPKRHTGGSRQELGSIRDGDIIVIVTDKSGLDYSHQGLAAWGKDGKLHMLHASTDFKRVIEDERPLHDYLQRIPHNRGIRVFRMK